MLGPEMRRHLNDTTSLCGTCKRSIAAAVWRVDDRVQLEKVCPDHGPQVALLSTNANWYIRTLSEGPVLQAPANTSAVNLGCPFDCGACEAHEQRVHLPVVPITSSCNLDCPICYTHNKNDGAYHMSREELRAILGHLKQSAPDQRIINLTGGEPTQHPQFLELVELCLEEGIHRVTISTHGLRFAKDEALVEKLGALAARVILSFDSFRSETNQTMLGGRFLDTKLQALARLEAHGVDTTLLPVIARGHNDDEIAAFVELALDKDFIRSVEFHPMTFTGQSGVDFEAAEYTAYDVLHDLETQTKGQLRVDDFVPSPMAHPLCYQVAYLLKIEAGRWIPFARFMERDDLRAMLSRGLYLEPGPDAERLLADVINRLWVGEIECDDAEDVLRALKDLVGRLFATDIDDATRIAISEASMKAIYVHTHMDERTFDTDRIRQCCVGMPAPDGSNIPSCAYNVLYRPRDERFVVQPEPRLVTLGPGRRTTTP